MTLKVNRGGIMNRQSTKKALLIPFILMVLTSIALVVVWFIFKPLVASNCSSYFSRDDYY